MLPRLNATTASLFSLYNLSEDHLTQWLRNRLDEDRVHHSMGTCQKAMELARNFGFSSLDMERVAIAGLLHDCAKRLTLKDLFETAQTLDIYVSDADCESPQTLHALVGAGLVQVELGIDDEQILNAIRSHTTGRPGMTAVEKMVYIADKVEGNTRNPLYTQKITNMMHYDKPETVDQAVLYIMDSTLTFLVEKGQVIHPQTVAARNALVKELAQHRQKSNTP